EDITVLGSKGITLLSFAGNRTKSGNELEWRVVKDGSVTYFNIYRRPVNPDVKIPAVSDELGGSAASRLIDNDKSALNDGFSWFKLTDVPIAITADNSYYYLDPYTGETEYEYKLEATTSSGAVELGTAKVSGNLPTTFALHQSRPNPAAGSATIAFSIPRALDVSLDVYDISGRKVATLVNGHLAEGEYERNVSGLQPGVYLYRIEAGEFNAVKKMVVK
ncbi:MAG: T9SS type A sorting domain-containing protein, partial [bacterium]|nr:T9SS type A sorting domain-containing protein [bacterium]